jgi:hypothetical protein
MTDTTPTTELEAVNAALRAIGETPVNSLNPGLGDASLAYDFLSSVTREVQSRGWRFNTEKEYPLPVDGQGFVNLPINTLRVSISDSQRYKYDVAQRGRKLYDRVNHTFVFTETLKVEISLLLTFEDMPECARNYVSVRAGRQFLDRTVGTVDAHGFSAADEETALTVLKEFEGETGDYNMLTGSYDVYRTLDRQSVIYTSLLCQ